MHSLLKKSLSGLHEEQFVLKPPEHVKQDELHSAQVLAVLSM